MGTEFSSYGVICYYFISYKFTGASVNQLCVQAMANKYVARLPRTVLSVWLGYNPHTD